jgi:hypothetical protein
VQLLGEPILISWAASALVFGDRRVVVVRHDEYHR